MSNKRLIDMREEELQELAFHAAKGACDLLFDGMAKRFLFGIEEEIRQIHDRLEQLERLVKMLIESRAEEKKVNVEAWKPNPELQKVLEKVDKDALKKSLEEAMKVNTLRTIPMPKVDIPEMKGADEE
jgi:hypothetical protein